MDRALNIVHNKTADRILVLKPQEGKNTLSVTGLIDNRLFNGGNQLHAVMDKSSCHWFLRYDAGIIPSALQQRFTSFTKLLNYTKEYFNRRNVDIVEVID